uniref:Zinc finger MYM-type protein 1-like n=1 Tax=Nicotiana tabacum TaxID=4097 RepID=A0A1S4D884_TOBAC|nr:PREDICTED: zinc finger MYM-type protein 1-like [Nicotiana tabacum]
MKRFYPLVSSKLPQSSSSSLIVTPVEKHLNQLVEQPQSSKKQRQGIDLDSLKTDPKERLPIRDFHPNERDEIRREYLRRDEGIHQGGGDVFSSLGFKSWHKKNILDMHGSSSIHNQATRKCEDLLKQKQSIQTSFDRQSTQTKLEYKICLKASIEVVRLLLNQGLAFRGHREDESSLNKGNFLEILSWYAERCDKIRDLVLKKAPKNDQLTSHKIQKDIIIACKIETVKAIMDDLNGDFFALLVDESCDVSRKEQLAIIMRYVNRCGSVVEHFIRIVQVRNTTALCLKKAIVDYLAQHSLNLSYVRGQCYDGASNMQGDLRGLKTLIQQESKSAYSIHCFAHQLQLTLVAVSKKCLEVGELVLLVSNVLNIVGGSFKRMDDLRESQAEKVQEALDMGELETGRGLNQELGLARAADTRWGSHYKSFKNFISMFGSIIDVLDTIVVDARTLEERAKAKGYLSTCQTFEVAFMLHLMRDVLGITNELNTSLQKKEQDIANAILLVEVAKRWLQKLREEEWDSLIDKVSAFCVNFNINKILRMAELYPDDFDENITVTLKNQLETYIVDLSVTLVKTKKHLNYPFVFYLVKFALLLPVATATVERTFSAMKLIKSELRNRMNDEFMSEELQCLELQQHSAISYHTLAGGHSPTSLRFKGHVCGMPVQVMVDNGSTHNFVQSRAAKFFNLVVSPVTPCSVVVGSG